ncbi:KxYKxGKxW signal peptide domain-containing protein [Streptococcus catagoni]|uniref:KxYKxGKxW signal peptide domain-containing protein n=1 Tax=Streptococcus catagoni TaxID=2654874 RepID=UPI00140E7864|nr:KxYKxGKxW signal peptide domain-containing protein [Streptococcus catagoni]
MKVSKGRFRTWKSGKQWLYMGVTALGLLAGGTSVSANTATQSGGASYPENARQYPPGADHYAPGENFPSEKEDHNKGHLDEELPDIHPDPDVPQNDDPNSEDLL